MLCPTCQEPLQKQTYDNQEIFHCVNCGSTFFDENSINRITAQSAEKLAQDKKLQINAPVQLSCPRDSIFMLPVEEDSVPKHVKLFECPQCKGLFASPEDLTNFKKAQDAKINYFKIWQIPLPSLQAVVVLSLVAAITIGLLTTTTFFQSKSLRNTQASEFVKNISLTTTNHYLFISFKTDIPLQSKITFIEQPSGKKQTKVVNSSFATFHELVTGDLDLKKDYLYQIILTDKQGTTQTTEPEALTVAK